MNRLGENHIYTRLSIRPFINAADSFTTIGGSRMPYEVLEAMRQAAEHFVELDLLHDRIGEEIARLTRNEAAMITSGAAAGITLSVAACVTGFEPSKKRSFPYLEGMKNEVIIHRCQRNAFDMAAAQLGIQIIEIGSPDATSEFELGEAIGPNTACILYFDTTQFVKGALSVKKVADIARNRGVPLIVDAAAQLPPVDNLWRYTELGADLVIFSGGKTLRGPQSSGFIVGKKELVRACRLHAGPAADAVGRPMKVGREEMAGLLAAIERYVNLDHVVIRNRHEQAVEIFRRELEVLGYRSERVYPGPTGQDYAFAMFDMRGASVTANDVLQFMKDGEPAILVGLAREKENHFCLNPLHVTDEDIPIIVERFKQFGPIMFESEA